MQNRSETLQAEIEAKLNALVDMVADLARESRQSRTRHDTTRVDLDALAKLMGAQHAETRAELDALAKLMATQHADTRAELDALANLVADVGRNVDRLSDTVDRLLKARSNGNAN